MRRAESLEQGCELGREGDAEIRVFVLVPRTYLDNKIKRKRSNKETECRFARAEQNGFQ